MKVVIVNIVVQMFVNVIKKVETPDDDRLKKKKYIVMIKLKKFYKGGIPYEYK